MLIGQEMEEMSIYSENEFGIQIWTEFKLNQYIRKSIAINHWIEKKGNSMASL